MGVPSILTISYGNCPPVTPSKRSIAVVPPAILTSGGTSLASKTWVGFTSAGVGLTGAGVAGAAGAGVGLTGAGVGLTGARVGLLVGSGI